MASFAALGLFAVLAAAAQPAAPGVTLEPPPGWEDVTPPGRSTGVVVALRGPETSSFVLTRIDPVDLQDSAVARTLLLDVLGGLNEKTGLGFTQASNILQVSYDNGLTARYILADYKGKHRLILAVTDFGGITMVGTLISAVPDTLMPLILGALREGSSGTRRRSPGAQALSSDGQLAFALAPGLQERDLTEREKKLGFVLAIRGLDSELMIMKLVDDSTPVKDQPQVVRDTVLSVGGVDSQSLSEAGILETPAGPDLVYAWARVKDASGEGQFAAGYMPWCYWGYSILAKGPRSLDLVTEAFKGLAAGPSALTKLLAQTPRVPVPRELRLRRGIPALPAALAVCCLLLILLLRRRTSSRPPG